MLKSLLTFLSCCMIVGMQGHAAAQDTVFSGPQVGEAMGEFRIKGFRGELNEKEIDQDLIKTSKLKHISLKI